MFRKTRERNNLVGYYMKTILYYGPSWRSGIALVAILNLIQDLRKRKKIPDQVRYDDEYNASRHDGWSIAVAMQQGKML